MERTESQLDRPADCPGLQRILLQGAIDTFELKKVTGSQKYEAQSICIPDDVTSEQPIRAFMKYSDDHPEELHKSAPLVVWEAMHQAFPYGTVDGFPRLRTAF
jgi:Rap1a immunity proteins